MHANLVGLADAIVEGDVEMDALRLSIVVGSGLLVVLLKNRRH